MMDEIRTLLRRNLPGYEVRTVTESGEGLENAAHEVNGELIVRTSKESDPDLRADYTLREANLLAAITVISTLPVPEPVFVDPEAGAIAYRKLPGRPLIDHPVAAPELLAPDLGGFLSRLHEASSEKLQGLVECDRYPMTAWLEDAVGDYQRISTCLPVEARQQIESFLGHPPPAEPRELTFCHNDLGAEHILVNVGTNTVTGIIDWTDAAVTDPARDLALVFRDLGLGTFERTLAHYGRPFDRVDRERAVFYARCKLLEDIAHGVSNRGARKYAEVGLSRLEQTFGNSARGG